MRKMKKLGAILLTGALMLSATACGGSTANTSVEQEKTLSVQERVVESQKKMQDVKSVEVLMSMDMGMKASQGSESQEFTMKMTGVTSMIQDPMKAKVEMTMDMGELGTQTTQSYMEEKDGKYVMYSGIEGTWTSYEIPADLASQYSAEESVDMYLKGFANAKEVGTEEIDGKQTTKIEGELSGKAMEKMIQSTGILDSLGTVSASDQDTLKKLFSEMGSLKLTLWLTDDNEVVKIEEDMTDMINQMIKKILAEGSEGVEMEITNAVMTASYDKINAVEDFEIPEEAKNATPIES